MLEAQELRPIREKLKKVTTSHWCGGSIPYGEFVIDALRHGIGKFIQELAFTRDLLVHRSQSYRCKCEDQLRYFEGLKDCFTA